MSERSKLKRFKELVRHSRLGLRIATRMPIMTLHGSLTLIDGSEKILSDRTLTEVKDDGEDSQSMKKLIEGVDRILIGTLSQRTSPCSFSSLC